MKATSITVLFITILSYNGNSQTFVSDSVAYRYVGNLSEDDGEILLRQFGLKNHITELPYAFKTEIIRDGDLIAVRTPLGPVLENLIPEDFEPWRIKIIGIAIQNRTDPRKTTLKNGNTISEQTFFGVSDMAVYHTDTGAFIPIQSMDSPNVTIIWQLIESNRDGKHKQLIFHLITSRDICEIIYCHPK